MVQMKKSLNLIAALLLFIHSSAALAEITPTFDQLRAEFELINASGEVVTERDIRGRNVLLAFGFTNCAHICPMMAANMALALKASQQDAIGVFISVDSERDTPAITQAFAASFHPAMMGLSGSYAQVRRAANSFNISFVVTKTQKAYTVEHNSDIFLIGPDGKILDVFAINASPKIMAEAMKPKAD